MECEIECSKAVPPEIDSGDLVECIARCECEAGEIECEDEELELDCDDPDYEYLHMCEEG